MAGSVPVLASFPSVPPTTPPSTKSACTEVTLPDKKSKPEIAPNPQFVGFSQYCIPLVHVLMASPLPSFRSIPVRHRDGLCARWEGPPGRDRPADVLESLFGPIAPLSASQAPLRACQGSMAAYRVPEGCREQARRENR
jgi:hypothetical protein